MKYSNAGQIIAMTIIWAVALVVYDRVFSKHLFMPTAEVVAKFTEPQIRIWVNHVACNGRSDELLQALKTLPWLSDFQVMAESSAPSGLACGKGVTMNVRDVAKVDFVELSNTLRKVGMIAAELEFGGIPHFGLRAEVSPQIRCEPCMQVARNAVSPTLDPKVGTTFKWLDSAQVNEKEQTVTAYARFGASAHAEELMRALEGAGFPLLSVRIAVGE